MVVGATRGRRARLDGGLKLMLLKGSTYILEDTNTKDPRGVFELLPRCPIQRG